MEAVLDPELLFDRILSVDDVAGLHAAGVAIADYFAVESFEIAYRIDDAPHILARVGAPLPPYEAHMAGVAEDDGLWSFVFGETDGALLRVRFRDGMLTPGQIGGIERAARCLRPAVLRILDQERARVLGRQLAILRDQARQAERLKEEFLSNLSHELRTPLTAILGFSEILIEKGAVQGAPSECAARIHQNGERLLKLLNRLLQLAKLESDRFNVHWAQVDVVAAIAESVAAVRGAAVAKGLTVALEVPELPPVMADARILRDALACVLENAVKFTDQGGLGLFARGDADHVYIVIRDTGRGIDATQLPFIFDAFWQGDGSLTRAVGGNGIGLTLASRLLSRIGGDVSVASLPGEGCTVTLQLQRQPLGSRTPSAPRRAPTEQYGLPF
jgi:signal transduction histidine kinase